VRPGWLGSLGWVSDGMMAKETETLLDKLQVNISRDDEIGIMSGGQRQAVACARAIAFGKRIVILDEPTSALGARESGNVLRLIKEAPQNGVSVIVISHNLEHVTRVADRAVVLRQGKYVGEAPADAEHQEELVSMIVGSGEAGEDDEASDARDGAPDERDRTTARDDEAADRDDEPADGDEEAPDRDDEGGADRAAGSARGS
jgi:ABC-type sugar transport system ATPase subunit